MISMSVQVGESVFTVSADDIRDVLKQATALEELNRDVRLLKATGSKQVFLRHRKALDENDYYELVGDDRRKIALGQYRNAGEGLSLFPGGFSKLYDPAIDSNETRDPDEFEARTREFANMIYKAADRSEISALLYTQVYPEAAVWPREARKTLDEFIGMALQKRRENQ